MKKKIKGYIKLEIISGDASPKPPIGPALGQKKVNIMEFCKAFNAHTQGNPGVPTPTIITVYEDNSFTFITKTTPASYLLKKAAGIEKGSKATKKEINVGKVTMAKCREIAQIKLVDLNTDNLEAATKIICGTATSMGIEVVGN